jgi:Phage portal protein
MGRVVRSLMHGWNGHAAMSHSYRSARSPSTSRMYGDRSIVTAIQTRMSVDLASIEFMHAILDPDTDTPISVVRDPLHRALTLSPNIDQSAQFLKQDAAMTMFKYGHCAIIPTDATMDPLASGSYDIQCMRVGRVVAWDPRWVTVEVYDDRDVDENGKPVNGGIAKQVDMPKEHVAIVENPFYEVMNEPSGTLQRLKRKLEILDGIDEAAGSGKLDLIMQLPYGTRGASRKAQAEARKEELYQQLKDDELGIGWIDVSEKVIQLNRPIDNKLLDQIKELKAAVYEELGLTPEVMNRTASPDQLNAYFDGTIEPIANAMALEFKRKFLTKTAQTQRHSIEIYRDPLKLIPVGELAEISDSLSRNAIITSNEFRPKIGYMPSKDPMADKLRNPNMPDADQGLAGDDNTTPTPPTPLREVKDEGLPQDAAEG